MRYRKLGNTGLTVSEIGFGTIPILSGNVPVLPDYYSPDTETAINIMTHALNLGCNLFDTAIVPEYGDAEIKLGAFAKRVGREKIIISDKSRFFTGNEIYEAVLTSCENLGTYADIYFAHQVDPGNAEATFGPYGAVHALTELKAEGKIRFTGIASHYYDILLRGAKDPRIDVLQGSGNILERGMLDRIEQESAFSTKGLLINKVYAAGILPGYFPVETLIEGVLSYPISSALIGLGTITEVDQALTGDFSSEHRPDYREILSVLKKNFSPIPCDRCQKCYCVHNTEIHTVFRQFNYFFLGKNYWALRKLDLSIRESAESCNRCTDRSCMKQCPKGLKIPQLMNQIRNLTEAHIRNSII
jgi:hypothetical protein